MAILSNANIATQNIDNQITKKVIATLLYADIFGYPLNSKEILQGHSDESINQSDINEALDTLCSKNILFEKDGLYSLQDSDKIFEDRIHKNYLAKKYLNRGIRISKFISLFPFVRGVFLSGSISKDCMDEDGDIDYFIITAPNRLWLARTLLISFKKIFLFNSYKFFCLNYFIDTEHLEIEEKNLYTATEIVTLIPTSGKECCKLFLASNQWVNKYKPNFPNRNFEALPDSNKYLFKSFMEWILNGKIGSWLDQYFQNVSVSFWKKKFKHFDKEEFNHAIKSKDYVSKAHPNNFQKRVLEAFDQKMDNFEQEHQIKLREVR